MPVNRDIIYSRGTTGAPDECGKIGWDGRETNRSAWWQIISMNQKRAWDVHFKIKLVYNSLYCGLSSPNQAVILGHTSSHFAANRKLQGSSYSIRVGSRLSGLRLIWQGDDLYGEPNVPRHSEIELKKTVARRKSTVPSIASLLFRGRLCSEAGPILFMVSHRNSNRFFINNLGTRLVAYGCVLSPGRDADRNQSPPLSFGLGCKNTTSRSSIKYEHETVDFDEPGFASPLLSMTKRQYVSDVYYIPSGKSRH